MRKWLLGILIHVVLLQLAAVTWLYLGMDYSCRCGGCELYPHLCMVGTCRACPTGTSSISDRFCPDCAEEMGVCQHCGEKKRLVMGVEDIWSPRW